MPGMPVKPSAGSGMRIDVHGSGLRSCVTELVSPKAHAPRPIVANSPIQPRAPRGVRDDVGSIGQIFHERMLVFRFMCPSEAAEHTRSPTKHHGRSIVRDSLAISH